MGLTRIQASQISDIDYKQSVRVVATSNVTLAGGAPATVDNVALSANDRVLVIGQSTESQNGIYYVQTVGIGSNGTWARTDDANTNGEIEAGMIVMVTEGANYADTQWKLTTNNPITVGSTSLTFVQNYSTSSISSGSSNVAVAANSNVTISSAGTPNVLVVTSSGANIAGTVSASGNITGSYFLGNGSQLSGIITTVSANTLTGTTLSSNVVNSSLTSVGTLSSLSVTGNVSGGNLNVTGNIVDTGALSIITGASGNISLAPNGTNVLVATTTGANVTGTLNATGNANVGNLGAATVAATTLTGTLSTAAQTNITSVGTLGSLSVTGNTTSGNLITGGLLTATGNVNTSAGVLATGNITGGNITTAGLISATGNVTVGNISATIGAFTTFTSAQGGNVTGTLVATSANAQFINQTNPSGYLTVAGYANVTGNVTAGNVITSGLISATGNITGGNLLTSGNIVDTGAMSIITGASGNVNLAPNGTNVLVVTTTGANITGTLNATGNANLGNLGTTQVIATGNITGGNLLINTNAVITGNLSVLGTETIFNVANLTVNDKDIIVANNVTGGANVNGAGIQAGNPATATWFFNNATTSWQSNIGITPSANGTLALGGASNYWGAAYVTTLSATGNANVGNLGATNIVGTLTTASQTNITSVGTLGSLSVTGNITGGNVLGGANVNATTHTGTTVSVTGNITGGNLTTAGRGNIGELYVTTAAGDEGGQMNLALAVTNTTLTGSVVIDVFQNRLRFYEGGGTARGAYIDLTAAGAGVSTNLLAGSGGTPGGSNTNVQFNDGGAFGGNGQFVYNKVTNIVTAGAFAGNTNGTGQNFQVGDDAWIGDINTADTIGLKGQQNPANAYLVFGNSDSTGKLGRAGTGPLTYAGAFSATGNITGGNLSGTSIVGTLTTAAQTNITSIGTLGSLSVTGNITGGNIIATLNGSGANVTSISATNISSGTLAQARLANSAVTLGSTALTLGATVTTVAGLTSVTSTTFVGALTGAATTAGTVTTAAQGNITSVGTLTSLAVTGNITSGNLQGTSIVGTLTTAAQTNITSVGTLGSLSVTGNITGGNIIATLNGSGANVTSISATNISSGTLAQARLANASVTVNGTSIALGGSGTVTATATNALTIGTGLGGTSYNGSTGVTITNTGVTSAVAGTGIGVSGATGAVTITNSGVTSVVAGTNIAVSGATGAVTVSVTGTVPTATSATTAGTVTTAAQGNITSVGTLTSLSVTGNITFGGSLVDTGVLDLVSGTNSNISLSPNGTGVIVVNKDIRNGQANGVGNIGASGATFNTVFAKATSAQYADVAENYLADADYAIGTVLEFGGNTEVTISTESHSSAVAGTVSDKPAVIMNSGLTGEHVTTVALLGRVPCRVVGKIRKGNLLVSSHISGVATALVKSQWQPGCVIGKALDAYDSSEPGVIEIVIGRL
jgi:hypothetical protein